MERDLSATCPTVSPCNPHLRPTRAVRLPEHLLCSARHSGARHNLVSFHRSSILLPAAGTSSRFFLSQGGTNLLNALGALEEPARGVRSPGHVEARQLPSENASDLGSGTQHVRETTALLISGNCRRSVVTMTVEISNDGQYRLRLICLMAKSEGSVCD